jgi:4-hydroxythreonine-4-phosphate dehydrogenase
MGDPAGIGPEIVLGALRKGAYRERANVLVVGSPRVFEACAEKIGWKGRIQAVGSLGEANFTRKEVPILDPGIPSFELSPGEVQEGAGRAALLCIERAARLCLEGSCDAVVTAPVNKPALKLAGCTVAGHTEILADLAGVADPLTVFVTGPLRIFFFSRHLSLLDAIGAIKKEPLARFLERVKEAMVAWGNPEPRIGVAGLNPHAGDGGLYGREEIEEIEPAIAAARERGVDAVGPIGADSLFGQVVAARGASELDCQVSLTHDQGHIAAKTLDFHGTVSVTLGLPFVRTSVDHGTAFDIAWEGKASPASMMAALDTALELLRVRPAGKKVTSS